MHHVSRKNDSLNRIRCPWHGACFNAVTGDIEDFPGLDGLHVYKVTVNEERDEVRVRAPARGTDTESTRRAPKLCRRDPDRKETIVVVGGGGAGQESRHHGAAVVSLVRVRHFSDCRSLSRRCAERPGSTVAWSS